MDKLSFITTLQCQSSVGYLTIEASSFSAYVEDFFFTYFFLFIRY